MKNVERQAGPAASPLGSLPTVLFLLTELVSYGLILFAGGKVAVYASFFSVVLCFAYGLAHFPGNGLPLLGGMAMTVAADFCLVICQPRQQLWGMVFFLAAQSLYAWQLHRQRPGLLLILLRLGLTVAAAGICVAVLKEKTDLLALISLCYYGNLVLNLIMAFLAGKRSRLLAIGFVLFLLCDTVIGLQEMAGAYLPIAGNHWLLTTDFNVPWVFYLPSQICIAIYGAGKDGSICQKKKKSEYPM